MLGIINRVALHELDNGWAISVIDGEGAYCAAGTFEVAVINPSGEIDYTHTDGDVLSYQTYEQIDSLIEEIKGIENE